MSTKLPRFETEEQVRELPEGVTMLLPRPTITLRLDEAVLERLRRLAAARNADYHALTRAWLVERLQEEEKAAI